MLDCKTYIRRSIRTIFTNVLDDQQFLNVTRPINPPLCPQLRPHQRWISSRSYATQALHDPDIQLVVPKDLVPSSSPVAIQNHSGYSNLPDGGLLKAEAPQQPSPAYKAADLEKELYWVRDPLKLAHKILNLLKRDTREDFVKALALVRQASKNMQCTVSWNHLVDYNMSKGWVRPAVGIYNEVSCCQHPPKKHRLGGQKGEGGPPYYARRSDCDVDAGYTADEETSPAP